MTYSDNYGDSPIGPNRCLITKNISFIPYQSSLDSLRLLSGLFFFNTWTFPIGIYSTVLRKGSVVLSRYFCLFVCLFQSEWCLQFISLSGLPESEEKECKASEEKSNNNKGGREQGTGNRCSNNES